MKIAVAQTRPHVGPVEGNLAAHQTLIELAIRNGVRLIVFPELSLTGYEPRLAVSLARTPEDSCFAGFQTTADQYEISIAVGVPTVGDHLPRISTLLFRPQWDVLVYSKQHLHRDEEPFFEPGQKSNGLIHTDPAIALAICYELTVPLHAHTAVESGATVYIASVAKSALGTENACTRMSEIAAQYSIMGMMSNCLGRLNGSECVGRSSAWTRSGKLLLQLDTENAGLIVLDQQSEEVFALTLSSSSQ